MSQYTDNANSEDLLHEVQFDKVKKYVCAKKW